MIEYVNPLTVEIRDVPPSKRWGMGSTFQNIPKSESDRGRFQMSERTLCNRIRKCLSSLDYTRNTLMRKFGLSYSFAEMHYIGEHSCLERFLGLKIKQDKDGNHFVKLPNGKIIKAKEN